MWKLAEEKLFENIWEDIPQKEAAAPLKNISCCWRGSDQMFGRF